MFSAHHPNRRCHVQVIDDHGGPVNPQSANMHASAITSTTHVAAATAVVHDDPLDLLSGPDT